MVDEKKTRSLLYERSIKLQVKNKDKSKIIQRILNDISKVPIPLRYRNTFTLLVSVLLSAQCTDVNVNNVTKIFIQNIIILNIL